MCNTARDLACSTPAHSHKVESYSTLLTFSIWNAEFLLFNFSFLGDLITEVQISYQFIFIG
jgi:hypothetical protein